MKIQLTHKFEDIVSVENLLEAWKEFSRGKKNRKDVACTHFFGHLFPHKSTFSGNGIML